MSYTNFIPTIWAEAIQRELERKRIFVPDCNRQFEGEIKKKGDQVRILGVGKPNIYTLDVKNKSDNIKGPEEIENNSVTLVIDQARYFNFLVDDIDRAQALNGLMDALTKEASEALADNEDTYVASLVVGEAAVHSAAQSVTEANVLSLMDDAIEKLYENDVSPSSDIVIGVSPKFYTLFRRAYTEKDTDNSEILKNGAVAKYGNVTVKLSNNIYRSDGVDHLMIRTKRAIAFAQQLAEVEAYRPEGKFADAVKGLHLFGAKVVRPKEILDLQVKYS